MISADSAQRLPHGLNNDVALVAAATVIISCIIINNMIINISMCIYIYIYM